MIMIMMMMVMMIYFYCYPRGSFQLQVGNMDVVVPCQLCSLLGSSFTNCREELVELFRNCGFILATDNVGGTRPEMQKKFGTKICPRAPIYYTTTGS